MSPISYTRSLIKVSVGQILQTVGFQTVQASALDILVEILERYIYLLSKTSHDFAELANRTEPCLDDIARAFDKHKVSIVDLEEYIKYVDTPEFELRKHTSKNVLDADKQDRFIPDDVKKRAKSKQKLKSYADYLGYCSNPNNKELMERQSDEENEHIFDYMPLMTLDKQKIQEAETILNQSAQNSAEESTKDSIQAQQSFFIVKNGQKFKNTSWKSVYEPKFLFKNKKDKENMQEDSKEKEAETKSKTPIGPSAMLPRYSHKPKSKYKRLIYANAVSFCNKSISGASNAPAEIAEQFDNKKIDMDQTNTEAINIEKIDETKVVKIEEGEEKVKPVAKTVSIVDQMLESLVTKYTTPASQQGPSQPQPVKNKQKEIVKEAKQVLSFNSSLALSLNDEAPVSTESSVPRLKLTLKNESETTTKINNFDENAMDGLEKASESILWKPICTDENISEKKEKVKNEPNLENKIDATSSSKHKKKKKNKDKNKSKDKEKEKKHKKKSEKDKSENDEETAKKKEDKKLKKLLKKQKKKMEKAAAAMANTASSCPDSSAIASSFTTTIETSQILLDTTESKIEAEQFNKIQQSPQDLSMKPKKQILNTNSTSTPIIEQKTLPSVKSTEPKLPKLKLKLNPNDSSVKPKSSLSQNRMEPVNFSTPQPSSNQQRPGSHSAQKINPQPKAARPVNMNQSMPARDIELGEVVQQKTGQKNPNNLVRHKSQVSNSTPKTSSNDTAKPVAKPQQPTKNLAQQQAKKEAHKVRPSTSNNSNHSMNQFNQIHQDQILFQEALAQEVQNALAQEALAREAILQEAYNNPQLLPIILPFLQAQNQVINPQFDLSALIAQASLQTLTTSQILEAQQLTQQQLAAQYATTSANPSKKRKTMDMESKSQNTSLNRSQNKPKSSQSLDQSMKRNSVSQQEYLNQDYVDFQQDESGLNPVDEDDEYKWHQMRVKQEEESLLEQVQALNMSRLTPVKKNCSFNTTPDLKKKNEINDQSKKNSAMKIIGQVVQETEIASNQYWSCPACAKSDDSAPMIACDSCDDWYHWHCIGLTEEPPENQNWYCHKCGTKRDTRNESEVDVESYEPIDTNNQFQLTNNLLNSQLNQPSDYLSNLKIKKKKK